MYPENHHLNINISINIPLFHSNLFVNQYYILYSSSIHKIYNLFDKKLWVYEQIEKNMKFLKTVSMRKYHIF